jgi:hypothetical protein
MADFAKLVLDADTTGLKKAVDDLSKVKKASQETGKEADESAKRFMKLHDKMFPEKAKLREYTSNLDAINEAHKRGIISTQEHAKMVAQLDKEAGGATAGLSKLAKIGIGALIGAATGAAAALGLMVRNSINTADEMMKASQAIGIGVDELSRLRYAAELSGVSFEGLKSSLNVINRNLFDVAGSRNNATKALAQMGIEARTADGNLRSSTDILKDMADVFQRMPDGAEKSALSMAVLGHSGAELIPLLNGGADAMNRLLNEADEFGIVIDERTGRRAEEFNVNLTRLGKVFEGLALRIASEMLPHLIKLQDWLIRNQDSIVALANAISTGIDRVINMAYGVGVLVDRVSDAWHSFRNWAPWIDTVTDKIGFLYDKVSFLLNPLGTMLNMLERVGEASRGAQEGLRESTIGGGFAALQRIFDEPGSRRGGSGVGGGGGGGRSRGGGGGRGGSALATIDREAQEAERALASLSRELQSVLDRAFPEKAAARRQQDALSTLFRGEAAGLISQGDRRKAAGEIMFGDIMEWSQKTSDVLGQEYDKMLKDIAEFGATGKKINKELADSFGTMADRALQALDRLAQGIQSGNFLSILSGILGIGLQLGGLGVFGKGVAANINSQGSGRVPSFAGGGFTGSGPRSGGVDGKGGFMAVLHPNETVTDHTKGGGQSVHVTVGVDPASGNITAFVDNRVAQSAPAIMQGGAQMAQAQMQRAARRRA